MALNLSTVAKTIYRLLEDKLPSNLYFHNVWHTKDVTATTESLARILKLNYQDSLVLITSALLHDTGYLQRYKDNEWYAVQFAYEYLPTAGYSHKSITDIAGLIRATSLYVKPTNKLQAILCDADLDYLGRDDYWELSNNYRKELSAYQVRYSDENWIKFQIDFLGNHKYYTDWSQNARSKGLKRNISRLKALL